MPRPRTNSRLQADKNDMAVLALEDAAREAANTIFSLRRHRIELITGEAGENVFGEGLKAALAEIERLEQSYLESSWASVSSPPRPAAMCLSAIRQEAVYRLPFQRRRRAAPRERPFG